MERERGLRINPSDLLLEIISIVIAILLALAVNSWQDHLKQERLLHQSLVEIRQELAANDRNLSALYPHHLEVFHAFSALDNAGPATRVPCAQIRDTFRRVDPRGFGPDIPASTAWEISQNSQAASEMSFDMRYRITRVYDAQRLTVDAQRSFIALIISPQTYAASDCAYAAYAIANTLGDVVAGEQELSSAYGALLGVLPRK
ncbi:MAG TPA: hypothetical protein VGZ02_07880 [Candidatus Baltobacteraceae bacterium]|jgi:hypothetical protein|nr:hypothetical protein [Candidatus Baltobacteraceae bacterium]